MADPTLAETVDAALAEVTSDASANNDPPADDVTTDSPASVAAEGAEALEDAESAEATEGDETSEPDAADGTDDATDGDETEGEGDPDAAEAAKSAALVKAEKAALDAPIPKDVKQETADRIKTLIDVAKKATNERDTAVATLTRERDTAAQERDQLVSTIQQTGMTPPEFGEHLQFARAVRNKDTAPQAIKAALTAVQSWAAYWGIPLPDTNPLAGHADLQAAVSGGQMTLKHAHEMALLRAGSKVRGDIDQSTRQNAEQQAAAQREQQGSRDQLTTLGRTLAASDQHYETKSKAVIKRLKTELANGQTTWAQLPTRFMQEYAKEKAPASATTRSVPANQPLRAKQGAGGQKTAPKSMLDAIDGALAGMG